MKSWSLLVLENFFSPKSHVALCKIDFRNIMIGSSEKKALELLFKRMYEIGYEFNI